MARPRLFLWASPHFPDGYPAHTHRQSRKRWGLHTQLVSDLNSKCFVFHRSRGILKLLRNCDSRKWEFLKMCLISHFQTSSASHQSSKDSFESKLWLSKSTETGKFFLHVSLNKSRLILNFQNWKLILIKRNVWWTFCLRSSTFPSHFETSALMLVKLVSFLSQQSCRDNLHVEWNDRRW